jgi:two-component system sensor histidine kinase KdpD
MTTGADVAGSDPTDEDMTMATPVTSADDAGGMMEAAGRFRIYLGAAAGVGKTYAMLSEGQRRRSRGADVVIAFVECHGR